ncbi:hypothetical protein [Bradyrhizobium sp. AZCC 1693]|uniref:hypothetical protein n=1 Tax=Bradyrhizobium sp. AZCC 1693 TaxID=3117029 RepID=UPI002FF436BC
MIGLWRDNEPGTRDPMLLADDREGTPDSVERLMGTKAEARFAFISDEAEFASDDLLDRLISP